MVGEQVLPKGRILILKVSDDSQVDDIPYFCLALNTLFFFKNNCTFSVYENNIYSVEKKRKIQKNKTKLIISSKSYQHCKHVDGFPYVYFLQCIYVNFNNAYYIILCKNKMKATHKINDLISIKDELL